VSTGTNEVDEIRRQMAAIRRELHEDVRGVVATAEAVTDWRRYLTKAPWLTLGATFAVGYLIVPKRRKLEAKLSQVATRDDVAELREAVEAAKRSLREAVKGQAEPPKRARSLLGAAAGLLVPVALRAAQGYAVNYLEQWIAHQQDLQRDAGPPPTPSAAPRNAGATRGPGPGPGPRPRHGGLS
jgi:hypothetical protein